MPLWGQQAHLAGNSDLEGLTVLEMFSQIHKNISLRYRGTKRYEYIEKEVHGLSRSILSNLRG